MSSLIAVYKSFATFPSLIIFVIIDGWSAVKATPEHFIAFDLDFGLIFKIERNVLDCHRCKIISIQHPWWTKIRHFCLFSHSCIKFIENFKNICNITKKYHKNADRDDDNKFLTTWCHSYCEEIRIFWSQNNFNWFWWEFLFQMFNLIFKLTNNFIFKNYQLKIEL